MPEIEISLENIIRRHRHQADYFTIVARKPFSRDSESRTVEVDSEFKYANSIHEAGYYYFLSKSDFQDIEGDISKIDISDDEFVDVAIHYAEYDAYPSWLEDRY